MPGGRPLPHDQQFESHDVRGDEYGNIEMLRLDSEIDDEEVEENSEDDSILNEVPSCTNSWYDLDYICAYSTTKTVYIQHYVLGSFYLLFTTGILLFLLLIMIVQFRQHLTRTYPYMSTRLLVEDITQALDLSSSRDTLQYCKSNTDTTNIQQLDLRRECVNVDEDLIIYPNSGNLYGIVTRTRVMNYRNVDIGRNNFNGTLQMQADDVFLEHTSGSVASSHYYNLGIEDVQFTLEHSFAIPVFGTDYTVSGYNIPGDMWKPKPDIGREIHKKFEANDKTTFTLKDLFIAAGFNNEDPLTELPCPYARNNATNFDFIRKCGLQLDVVIYYDQLLMNLLKFEFEMWVFANTFYDDNNLGFSSSRVVPISEDNYLVYEYNGIQLRFMASGRIGKLEIWTLMLVFMTTLVLISVAQLIVDTTMLSCLKERKMYFFMKYEITADVEELFSQAKLQGYAKEELYVEAAKAQANPQIKEQDNRAEKLITRMKKQFDEEIKMSMDVIREQLSVLRMKNTELVTIQDQTLAAVVQAFEWDKQDMEELEDPQDKSNDKKKGRRFNDVELKSVVATVVFLPIKDKINWKDKSRFARWVRDALIEYEPERIEGRKILTSRGTMIAAQVELGKAMLIEQIDDYNKRPKKEPYLKNFLLVSYKDIVWTEMEMIFDSVDPEQTKFVTEDKFRELMNRTSKMGKTKIDYYYKRLRDRNKDYVGVDLDEIAKRMFEFADKLETCGCSVILVAVLKEMMKEMQQDRERDNARQRDLVRPLDTEENIFAPKMYN